MFVKTDAPKSMVKLVVQYGTTYFEEYDSLTDISFAFIPLVFHIM